MKTASCSSCGKTIVWAQTEQGKPVPITAEPFAHGNVVLQLPADPRDPPVAHYLRKGETALQPRYVSHFADCPQADQHRKAKR